MLNKKRTLETITTPTKIGNWDDDNDNNDDDVSACLNLNEIKTESI